MLGNFDPCCQFSLIQEGGFCNVEGDPGGSTNHGITMAELSVVLGRQATIQDVMNLTVARAEAIYQPRYWNAVSGNGLPAGIDLMTFDFGINAGPGTSAIALQGLLGLKEDGEIGPVTLSAIKWHDPQWIIAGLSLAHTSHYQALAGFGQFGSGWLARNGRAQKAASAMAPA